MKRFLLFLAVVPGHLLAIESPFYDGGHWAFQLVVAPPVPEVQQREWPAGDLDRFLLAGLEAKGLQPAPSVDRRTLLRRVYIDLIGLSPSYDEVAAFVADARPDGEALAEVVDALLARPQYGERWGRYWLDLARYADTKGYVFQENRNYPFAYTYRDWVVRALNEDMPYDRFLRLQIAADQVEGARTTDLAAMGFLTVGRRFLNKKYDIIDDRIDVLTRSSLGLTVACARCHDHPFDPIPTTDYYALFGVFDSSIEPESLPKIGEVAPGKAGEAYLAELGKRVDHVHAYLTEQIEGYTPPEDRLDFQMAKWAGKMERKQRDEFKKRIGKVTAWQTESPHAPARAMVMNDRPKPVPSAVLKRGSPGRRGEAVERRFLTVLSAGEPKPFADGSGRLNLAAAIADPANPLTARVMVNRVWFHHMGQALVRTQSDFGLRTELPEQAALLDFLAHQLVADAWSLKALHRRILLSSAYRMQDRIDPAAFDKDPDNRWYWRGNRQRLDFEAMRDGLLQASGKLDLTLGGKPVTITTAPFAPRRTIYAQIDRQNLPGLFRTFDLAGPDAHAPQRAETTTPQQSLFLMNSPFVLQLAKHLEKDAAAVSDPIGWLYRRVLLRDPIALERAEASSFLENAPPPPQPAWAHGYGGIDAQGHVVRTPLPHRDNKTWCGGPDMPDPVLGYALLHDQGGHPGSQTNQMVIRSWTAPETMRVTVQGRVSVPSKQSNGVEAWVTSSRTGLLKHLVVLPVVPLDIGLTDLTVEAGETLHFVVGNHGANSFDSFLWAPTIQSESRRWAAADAFTAEPGTRISPLGQLAQVLLLSNEFAFVD